MNPTDTVTDPVTTEIIRCALGAAAEDMNQTLIRSAYTPTIYEMKDCSVALLDEHHRVLGQSLGVPIFLGNLEVVTQHTEREHGRDGWRAGDVWILNDPYIAGTHLNDVSVYGPVFAGEDLVGFATCRAHLRDLGGMRPGLLTNSTEIYQEGLRLGAIKLVEGGEPRRDILDIITRNSRYPDLVHGDLFAMIACVREGQARLDAVIERYGLATFRAARDDVFAQTERMERAAVAAIADGVYEAEGHIDNDGVGDTPLRVHVRVEVSGENILIDLSGTDDMTKGPVNCGAPQAVAAARVAFKLLVNPDGPLTGGAFRPLSVNVREGSLFAAEEPVPCSYYFTPLGMLIDLVAKALAHVLPERVAAASYGDSMVVLFGGTNPDTGQRFSFSQPTVGGWGAWHGTDGQDAMINNVNGAMKDLNAEVIESKFPIRVTKYAIRPDSGGPGQWRGGNGVEREFVFTGDDGYVNLWWDRSVTPAWGIFGGSSAQPPEVVINQGRADERRLMKATGHPLQHGDVVLTRSGGGGGYGDPSLRSVDDIKADIREGQVTEAGAQDGYGWDEGVGS
ncbi:hydantoinase B/oxoprolinase family protein [Amycolatopsis sp. GM8]|uniref:hydantoinase B/oxoprolinase family protein n=1 Tax=Amycolatopsis sp. GM8 TaxID=2896530 RepID=UPI001F3C6447|nr:hydantoinase B/oxoprolinase family protein [Amycolatopsis sp. GM8]